MIPKLKEQYTACCQAYADIFIKTLGETWIDTSWVGGTVGGTLCTNGSIFNMSDIVYAVDSDMTADSILQWYHYNILATQAGFFDITLPDWNRGASRVSESELEHLISLKSELISSLVEGPSSPAYANALAKYDTAYNIMLNTLGIEPSDM